MFVLSNLDLRGGAGRAVITSEFEYESSVSFRIIDPCGFIGSGVAEVAVRGEDRFRKLASS